MPVILKKEEIKCAYYYNIIIVIVTIMNRYITSSITALNSPYLSINNTGLGNVLFQIASVYGIAKSLNINCDFPYVKIFGLKLKELYNYNHLSVIFRNVPMCNNDISYEESIRESNNRKYDNEMINKIKNSTNNIIIDYSYLEDDVYFENYKNEIVELFSPDEDSYSYIINKYFNNMEDYTIISVHYRNDNFSQMLNDDYYIKARNYMMNNTKNPFFYIFSDDISKVNLSIYDNYKIIEKEVDYIHLWTMSLCHHNIISNSTFSWWAAYLNKNDDKIVLCSQANWNYFRNFISI